MALYLAKHPVKETKRNKRENLYYSKILADFKRIMKDVEKVLRKVKILKPLIIQIEDYRKRLEDEKKARRKRLKKIGFGGDGHPK